MGQDLIRRREQAMDRADRALDAAWPERKGADYVREMNSAAKELEAIAAQMRSDGSDLLEQSRTYRYLGSVYSDLAPALGKEMLLKAKEAYQEAETLLKGLADEAERAKLNFDFANTLRQINPNDIQLLQEAKERLLAARKYFAGHASQHLSQVDTALESVENLLKIAPIASAVEENTRDMKTLEKELADGRNAGEIAEKMREVMKRKGGAAGLIGQLKAIVESLPADQKKGEKFVKVQREMEALTKQVLDKGSLGTEESQILSLLHERLRSDFQKGKVTDGRAETLTGILDEFEKVLSGDEGDAQAMLEKLQKMRDFVKGSFEMLHYLSHGLGRPPAGSRAAALVERCWQPRRYLLEEMNRSGKGEEESKEALDLNLRATRVDKRIYEAGADDVRALNVEKEELRPLALAVRNFSARMNSMPARPIWHSADISVATDAVFYSGPPKMKSSVAAACQRLGLELMPEPMGESYANARWKQLQKAMTTIFDLRVQQGPEQAAVTYELGIALTIGKSVVVLVAENQAMPFDVDVAPVELMGNKKDVDRMVSAIDLSLVWIYPKSRSDVSSKTLEYVLSKYPRPHRDVYVDQTLRMLAELRKEHDPLAITRTLSKFVDYLKDGETMLIQPVWSPVYPKTADLSLFHVMPFRPKWANEVATIAQETSEDAGVKYIRGDKVEEPDVIRCIWEEIAQATHVLVDLTGFNANVALELGIAHTLGKNLLLVGQDETVDHLFPSIRKMRVHKYSVKQLKQTLGTAVRKFISS